MLKDNDDFSFLWEKWKQFQREWSNIFKYEDGKPTVNLKFHNKPKKFQNLIQNWASFRLGKTERLHRQQPTPQEMVFLTQQKIKNHSKGDTLGNLKILNPK